MAKDRNRIDTNEETVRDIQLNSINEDSEEKKVIKVTRTLSTRGKLIFIVVAILIIAAAAFTVSKAMKNREYEGYSIVSSFETSGDSIADYVMFAGNVLKVSKDGAAYIDETGNTVWDCSYAMKMPEAVVSDDYAVVADLNGRDVYVFNKAGKVSNQTMNYDIANVDVASQGVYALVLVGEDCNYINGYDKDSKGIYEFKTSIENSGYPLDISISNDGTKLFTSYLKVDGTAVPNYIAAYNFGSVGQNENADRLMGGFTFDETVFPLVDFVDNDTAVCFGDNQIVIYTMPEKPSQKAVIDIGNTEMLGVFANSKYVGYIALADSNADYKYTINIYSLDGKLEATAGYNSSFEKIYATEEEIVIIGDFDCSIYRFNGTKKFSSSFNKNLINIVPDSNKLEYILIFENETQIIKLKRSKNEE
ncbi:MAG: DUF5711 family protein [Coprococcus sp.]